jgi:hypothetical protein
MAGAPGELPITPGAMGMGMANTERGFPCCECGRPTAGALGITLAFKCELFELLPEPPLALPFPFALLLVGPLALVVVPLPVSFASNSFAPVVFLFFEMVCLLRDIHLTLNATSRTPFAGKCDAHLMYRHNDAYRSCV